MFTVDSMSSTPQDSNELGETKRLSTIRGTKPLLWELQQQSQQEGAFPGHQGVIEDKSSQMIGLMRAKMTVKPGSAHTKPERGP